MAKLKMLKEKDIQHDVKLKVEQGGIGAIAMDNRIQLEFYLAALKGYIDSRKLKDQVLKAQLQDLYNKYHRDLDNSIPVSSRRLINLKQEMIELDGYPEVHKVIYNAYTQIERELMISTIMTANDIPRFIKLNLQRFLEDAKEKIKNLTQDMKTRYVFAGVQHYISSLKDQDVKKWYPAVTGDTIYFFRLMAKRYQENGNYSITDRQMFIVALDDIFPRFGGNQTAFKNLKIKIIALYDGGRLDTLTENDFKTAYPKSKKNRKAKFNQVVSLVDRIPELKRELELHDPVDALKNKALVEFRSALEVILSLDDAKREVNVEHRVQALKSTIYELFVDTVNNSDDINSGIEMLVNTMKTVNSDVSRDIYSRLNENYGDLIAEDKFTEICNAMNRAVGNEDELFYEESFADSESPAASDSEQEEPLEIALEPINIEVEFKEDLVKEIFKNKIAAVFKDAGDVIQKHMAAELPRYLRFADGEVKFNYANARKAYAEFPGKNLGEDANKYAQHSKEDEIAELITECNNVYQSDMTRNQYLVNTNFSTTHLNEYLVLLRIMIEALRPYTSRGDAAFDQFIKQAEAKRPPIRGTDISKFTEEAMSFRTSFKDELNGIVADYLMHERQYLQRELQYASLPKALKEVEIEIPGEYDIYNTNRAYLYGLYQHFQKVAPYLSKLPEGFLKTCQQLSDKYALPLDWNFKPPKVQAIVEDYVAEQGLEQCVKDRRVLFSLVLEEVRKTGYNKVKSFFSGKTKLPRLFSEFKAYHHEKDRPITKDILKHLIDQLLQSKDKKFKARVDNIIRDYLIAERLQLAKEIPDQLMADWALNIDDSSLNEYQRTKSLLGYALKKMDLLEGNVHQAAIKYGVVEAPKVEIAQAVAADADAPTITIQAPKAETATAEVKQFTEKLKTINKKFTVEDHVRGELHTKLKSDSQVIEVKKTEDGFEIRSNNPSVAEDVLAEQLNVAEHFSGQGCLIKVNGGSPQQRLEILKMAKAKNMKVDFAGSDLKAEDYKDQDLEDFNSLKRETSAPAARL